jgi:hypothetical protein
MLARTLVAFTLLLGAGCSKRIAECEAYVATFDKLVQCEALPESGRERLRELAAEMRAELKRAENASDDARDSLADSCRRFNETIVEQYRKTLPDCLK